MDHLTIIKISLVVLLLCGVIFGTSVMRYIGIHKLICECVAVAVCFYIGTFHEEITDWFIDKFWD